MTQVLYVVVFMFACLRVCVVFQEGNRIVTVTLCVEKTTLGKSESGLFKTELFSYLNESESGLIKFDSESNFSEETSLP